jgi:hypothetical protein
MKINFIRRNCKRISGLVATDWINRHIHWHYMFTPNFICIWTTFIKLVSLNYSRWLLSIIWKCYVFLASRICWIHKQKSKNVGSHHNSDKSSTWQIFLEKRNRFYPRCCNWCAPAHSPPHNVWEIRCNIRLLPLTLYSVYSTYYFLLEFSAPNPWTN